MIDLSKLLNCEIQTAVWVIDIEKSTIPWHNKAAEALLEDSLVEIESGARMIEKALQEKLLRYLSSHNEGDVLSLKWPFTAKGIQFNCIGSIALLSDGRKGLSVEAHPVSHQEDNRDAGLLSQFKTLLFAIFDDTGQCLNTSESFSNHFGVVPNLRDLFAVSSASKSFVNRLNSRELISQEIMLSTRQGVRWHHLEVSYHDEADRVYLLVNDIQEERDHEVELYRLNNYDGLTNLPNRNLLYQQLESALVNAKKRKREFGLLYLDLDGFKVVNDNFGHRVGDELIQRVAERIQKSIPSVACLYRLGGDEFVVVLENTGSIESLQNIANGIMQNASHTYPVAKMEIMITASIGIASYPQHGSDVDSLLKNADAAMYRAKSKGHNMYFIYENSMGDNINAHLTLGNGLRKAIKEEQFELYYQPKISLPEEELVGAEALIRWRHPELGMIAPDQFIPLAEESGLIIPLGEWVIKRACRQLKEWRELGYPPINLSINLSSRQFMQADLVDMVKQCIDDAGVDPKYLELELTESMLMADAEQSIAKLLSFRELGLTLSIDDFGTGYSSLSYLKKFPIQTLKIDRSFIDDLGLAGDDDAIVKATIAMAKNLNLKVIAEGVENRTQLDILNSYQCEEVQGYLFSRPLCVQDFLAYMDSHASVKLSS